MHKDNHSKLISKPINQFKIQLVNQSNRKIVDKKTKQPKMKTTQWTEPGKCPKPAEEFMAN